METRKLWEEQMISNEPIPPPGVTLPKEETPKKRKKTLKEVIAEERGKKATETEDKVLIDLVSSGEAST